VSKYALSPLATVARTDTDGQVVIHGGTGFDRQRIDIGGEGGGAFAFVTWVLCCSTPAAHDELCQSLANVLHVATDEAAEVVAELLEAGVLVEAGEAQETGEALRSWSAHGWDEAALFHRATFGQPFDPDTLGDVSYEEYYQSILDDLETAGPQPPVTPPAPSQAQAIVRDGDSDPTPISFKDVLDRADPINRFADYGIDRSELHRVLAESFGAQRIVEGILGEHLIKAYPSGGARHPLELYVVAKSVSGLPEGVHHFDARDGALRPVPDAGPSSHIDAVCFGKGGIVTASAVLVITSRWLRHSWKYRYSRSYRMVLLELGHAIQAIHLSARAEGLGAYHCPSVNDMHLLSLLGLTDDCLEGPLYAVGIGKEGIR
jgi:SagB-type dehydrogenase family enzyme